MSANLNILTSKWLSGPNFPMEDDEKWANMPTGLKRTVVSWRWIKYEKTKHLRLDIQSLVAHHEVYMKKSLKKK